MRTKLCYTDYLKKVLLSYVILIYICLDSFITNSLPWRFKYTAFRTVHYLLKLILHGKKKKKILHFTTKGAGTPAASNSCCKIYKLLSIKVL